MKEQLTDEYKKSVINQVQKRIDSWIGRDYYFGHEAIWLKTHDYPYRIAKVVDLPILMVLKQDINYINLFKLVRKGVFEEDVKFLFDDVMENHLFHVFGG